MRNAQAQKRLVESLLDLSRVLAGKLELALEILDLQPVLDAAVDALQPEALKGNVVLDVRRSDRRIRVAGDGPRLQQVFWNCLSNAIKFTPPGGRVRATVTTSGGEAHIEIADNGCGISPELLPFVFDRFTQGGHGHGGLGIGLALVRELVLGHGGRVTAASDGDGCGSVLTVSLPLAVGSRTVSSPADEEADLAASHPRILIVDDEHDARDMRN
jgi:signal transduction histidine kinase